MKKIRNVTGILACAMAFSLTSCSHLTVKKPQEAQQTLTADDSLTEARNFVKNVAAMQYIEYATVVGDTAFVGVPSRRGAEHSQDDLATIILQDTRKSGNFLNIKCCQVVNTAKDFVWSDTLVSGQIIGQADVQ